MRQGKRLYETLNTAARQHVDKHPFIFTHCIGGTEFTFDVSDSDKFTTVLRQVTIRNKAFGETEAASMELLGQLAERFAAKVGPSLHNLKVVEADNVNCKILLKSTKSTDDRGRVSSYEAVLTLQGEIDIARFRTDRDAKQRELVPFAMTREALQVFIQNLCEVACWPAP